MKNELTKLRTDGDVVKEGSKKRKDEEGDEKIGRDGYWVDEHRRKTWEMVIKDEEK